MATSDGAALRWGKGVGNLGRYNRQYSNYLGYLQSVHYLLKYLIDQLHETMMNWYHQP